MLVGDQCLRKFSDPFLAHPSRKLEVSYSNWNFFIIIVVVLVHFIFSSFKLGINHSKVKAICNPINKNSTHFNTIFYIYWVDNFYLFYLASNVTVYCTQIVLYNNSIILLYVHKLTLTMNSNINILLMCFYGHN